MKRILWWLRKRWMWKRISRSTTTSESDRARVAKMLMREAAYADALCGFLCHGFNHGKAVKITIEIDGTACEVGILATGNEPLMEYLANWAVGEKMKKMERMEEFYKAIEDGEGVPIADGVVDLGNEANLSCGDLDLERPL